MVELDEAEAAEMIQKLLDSELSTRKEGFTRLREVTYENWDIKYREYLWKAIEEEDSKSFQKELVQFAVHKMQADSLRKMIRFIENGDLHAGSIGYISKKYMELETDVVREALIKSLQRDKINIVQFVLRLLNEFEFYHHYAEPKYRTLVQDILGQEVPLVTRKEFLIRLMNWYFRGSDRLLLQAKIWNIIQEDLDLQIALLNGFYLSKPMYDTKFVEPSYFPRLLPFRKISNFRYTRDRNIFTWIETSKALDFLYSASSSNHQPIQKKYIEILASIPIPDFDLDSSRDGDLFNLYKVWDQVTINSADILVTEVEEFDISNLISIFPSLENDEHGPDAIFQGVNPHAVFYCILRYLPRYLLVEQVKHSTHTASRTLAMKQLINGKYWVERRRNHILHFEPIGSAEIWKQVFSTTVSIVTGKGAKSVKEQATRLFFYLADLLMDEPNLDTLWKSMRRELQDLKKPIEAFSIPEAFNSMEDMDDFLEKIDELTDLDLHTSNISTHQTLLQDLLDEASSRIKDFQTIVDSLLEGQELLANVDRELIKFNQQLLPLGEINYWFELLLEHIRDKLSPIQSFSNNHSSQFDLYLKRIGDLSEQYREVIQIIGDPKEFSPKDQEVLDQLNEKQRMISRKINSLSFSPYRFLDPSYSSSISQVIDQSLLDLVDHFKVQDPANLRDDLRSYLNELSADMPDDSSLQYRLHSPDTYDRIPVELGSLGEGELFQIAGYLLQQSETEDVYATFSDLFSRLSENNQLKLVEIYANLARFNLLDISELDDNSFNNLFRSSKFVKVRTRASLLLKNL